MISAPLHRSQWYWAPGGGFFVGNRLYGVDREAYALGRADGEAGAPCNPPRGKANDRRRARYAYQRGWAAARANAAIRAVRANSAREALH
jgi:hypothetical protein